MTKTVPVPCMGAGVGEVFKSYLKKDCGECRR